MTQCAFYHPEISMIWKDASHLKPYLKETRGQFHLPIMTKEERNE